MTESAKHTPELVLVPKEPTEAMIRAAANLKSPCVKYRDLYRAMLSAAPAVEAQERLIETLTDALKSADAMIDFMSRAALEAGLSGTIQWDRVAGGADMYGTQDEIRTALAQAKRIEQP